MMFGNIVVGKKCTNEREVDARGSLHRWRKKFKDASWRKMTTRLILQRVSGGGVVCTIRVSRIGDK